MKHPVVQAAKEAFKARVMAGSDVSTHTKNAQAIAKAWRTAAFELAPPRYQYKVPVRPEFDQRIDMLDQEEMCAFEFRHGQLLIRQIILRSKFSPDTSGWAPSK
jgi:hypothetical protein